MGLVFDAAELVNILTDIAGGEATTSVRSKLADSTLRRSLRRQFRQVADNDFPDAPEALRRIVSSRDYIDLICGADLRADAGASASAELREAAAGMDEIVLSRLEARLRAEAISVIAGPLSIGERADTALCPGHGRAGSHAAGGRWECG